MRAVQNEVICIDGDVLKADITKNEKKKVIV